MREKMILPPKKLSIYGTMSAQEFVNEVIKYPDVEEIIICLPQIHN
jgi:hypothetical protein